MLIRHLDFFVTLAEEQHFGRAADLCGVSQPALSLAVRKLEEHLGTVLIIRGQRFAGLTAEGAKVLVWARRILADYGSLRDDLSGRRKGGLTGTLRLGVTAWAMPLAPPLSARFEARNPLARLEIRLMRPEAIGEGIVEFALDGGLTWLDGDRTALPAGHIGVALGRERALFACRKDHPFASAPGISWGDAATQPLCVTDDAMRAHLATIDFRPAITCASLDGVLAHLREGLWCSIVPEGFRGLLGRDDDIVLCPLTEPDLRLTQGIVLPERNPQSPMVQALLDCALALQEENRAIPA